ncbi:MAG: hypothetical protein Q8P95_03640, partial [bacterium]|nr:hypothetical protein [bacterium]
NFVWAMATQFQGLHHINKVTQLTSPEFTTLTINALFSIVFAVLYGVAYIAMFIILISRMVVLWLLIMLSPLLAITIAIPDILPEKLSLKTFIDHAFVPAKMAVPLSLGYIMVSQMALAIDTNSIAGQDIDLSQSGEFTRGGSVLSLMYGIASVAVIWLGVFTASENVVGSSLVGKLKDLTSSAGQKISRWPAYLPIVPTSHGLASYSSIKYAVQEAQSALAERQLQKDKAFAAHLGLKNEVGDAIAEIKRVTDKKDFDQKMVAGMATLSRGDQREYLKQNKLVAGTEWGAQGERVGRSMGFDSFSEYQQAVKAGNTTLLREKLAAASSAGGGGGGGPEYETTKEYQNGKLTLDAGNLSTSGKTLFSIESGESGKDIPFELKNLDINKFLNGLGDLSPGDSRNVLSERNRGGVTGLDQFMGSQSFIQQAKGDTKLKDALRKNFILDPQSDEDKATNKWLYARLKAVYGMEYDDKGAEVKARTKKDADFLVELRLLKDAKEALPGWM